MKAMVGSTILTTGFEAGEELAQNSIKGLKNPKLGLLFSSTKSFLSKSILNLLNSS